MKKNIFIMIAVILSINIVFAEDTSFDINIEEIKIDGKSNSLIENLDKQYNIETDGFKSSVTYNEQIKDITKELVSISLSNEPKEEKLKRLSSYVYISENGFGTLTTNAMINTFLDQLGEYEISYDYVQIIRTVEFDQGILSFVYLPDITLDDTKQDMVLVYWFKENKLYFPWFNLGEDLESYFNEVANKEDQGQVIGGSYKNISLTDNSTTVTEETLNKLYNENIASNVQMTSLYNNGTSMYGSGFYIREGVVVTTWSLFLQFLNNGDYIYINDSLGNVYQVEGVIAANTDYDVVVLKTNKEIGQKVNFAKSETLKTDDKLFMINSKLNSKFSINYGSFVKEDNGKLSNMMPVSNADVGGALYDINGNVVAFTTGNVLNSQLSYANSTDYLIKLQKLLEQTEFNNIKYTDIEIFKNSYYKPLKEELEYNDINDNMWDKFSEVGNIKESINLPLIKASYEDGILSLRYKNSLYNSLDNLYLLADFTNNLLEQDFEMIYEEIGKQIYVNDNYQVIIKQTMNYFVVLIMEI